ncbi:MAG: ROK family protein [Mariprofundus sp.]|nr:ROK family protein [Mariprofundus sp.]
MRVGIDLGGSKTELIALDDQGTEQLRFRRPTPAGTYDATVSLIAEMVQQAEAELGMTASTGLGTPGAVSLKNGLMKNCNSTCLNGQPLKEDIEHVLQREVRLSNDANCFALSEAIDGAGAGHPVVFGVILGTGVGGGLVVNGQVLGGVNHIAGEWGHNPLPIAAHSDFPGPACYCGRNGCIEAWLSGPAMQAEHHRHQGTTLTASDIASAAQAGDVACLQTLEIYCERLAGALAVVINIIDPDVIVLGGGLANIDMLYSRVPLLWHRYIFSDDVRTRLLRPVHGDSSGVRGAAWLWGD